MKRRLIIDGNAVYEIDEDCMLGKRLDQEEEKAKGYRQCPDRSGKSEERTARKQ